MPLCLVFLVDFPSLKESLLGLEFNSRYVGFEMHALVQNPTDLDSCPPDPVSDVMVLDSVESNTL